MGILMKTFLVFLFVFAGGLVIYLQKGTKRTWDSNLQLAAKILNSELKKSLNSALVEGDYKDRKIAFRCDYAARAVPIVAEIKPHTVPKQQKKFVVSYPRPTKYTNLQGEAIVYQQPYVDNKRNSTGLGQLSKCLSEQDIINVFEELTRAAEVVESNSPYYKG